MRKSRTIRLRSAPRKKKQKPLNSVTPFQLDLLERNGKIQTRQKWRTELVFLDQSGNKCTEVPGPDNRAIELFTQASLEEAVRFASEMSRIHRTWMPKFTDKELAEIHEFRDQKGSGKGVKGLARKFIPYERAVDRLVVDAEERLALYKIISPHTFCFIPYDPSNTDLPLQIRMILDDSRHYQNQGDPWIQTKPVTVYETATQRATIGGLFATDKPTFKLKFQSRHTIDKFTDLLDIEAEFRMNRFASIAHYHVEKPYTLRQLYVGDMDPTKFAHRFEFSIARPRREKTSERVVRSVTMKWKFGKGEERRTRTDEPILHEFLLPARYWVSDPVILGGTFFQEAIKIAGSIPEIEALQNRYGRH